MDKPLNVRAHVAAYGHRVMQCGASKEWFFDPEAVGLIPMRVPAYSTVGEAMGLLEAWRTAKPGQCRWYEIESPDGGDKDAFSVTLYNLGWCHSLPTQSFETLPETILRALASTP